MTEDEGFVLRHSNVIEKVRIPRGYVRCPLCKGSGELRRYYGQPWDRGQFETCHACSGRGFMKEEDAEFWEKESHRKK